MKLHGNGTQWKKKDEWKTDFIKEITDLNRALQNICKEFTLFKIKTPRFPDVIKPKVNTSPFKKGTANTGDAKL